MLMSVKSYASKRTGATNLDRIGANMFDTLLTIFFAIFFIAMLWNYVIGEEIKDFITDIGSMIKRKK